MITTLAEFQQEVKEYHAQIESNLKKYITYGIFQSPFYEDADNLILGINPGTSGGNVSQETCL